MVKMTPAAFTRLLLRLRYVFIGLFVLAAAGTWTYELLWVQPAKKCEAAQRWWDPGARVCAIPVSISTFTHRPIPAGAIQP